MAQNKRKKLSLDEARAMFTDGPVVASPSKNAPTPTKGKPTHKPHRKPSVNAAQIQQKIAQLGRKVMEGNLTPEEEKKVLAEIEYLEKKIH